MDPTTILTGVGTVIAIVGTNIALIGWLRSDLKDFRSELKAFETKMDNDRRSFETKLEYWQEGIAREMKDFHGRLCTQEEKIRNVQSVSNQ